MALSAFAWLCAITTAQSQNKLITPKETLCPLHRHSHPPPPSSWQPLICFLSLRIYLFWTFHINGII